MFLKTDMKVSLETVLAASPLLGHPLEDRRGIRDRQDADLACLATQASRRSLRGPSQRDIFCVAPLDILVSDHDGYKKFHLLELNGTGIGGLTNLPHDILQGTLVSLEETAESFAQPDGLVLVAVSGKECQQRPRLNRLMHEKLLFVEAIRQGLNRRHGSCKVWNLESLSQQAAPARSTTAGPGVVLGYIKELLGQLNLDAEGRLWLHGRPVVGAVNDRFCRNLLHHFGERVDLRRLRTLNQCFLAGSDKGVAYGLFNEYVAKEPHPSLPPAIHYEHAQSREDLTHTVHRWLGQGRQVVIKPHGTGLGHGIEFFLCPDEDPQAVNARIDGSIAQTQRYYGLEGGAFPYTVCEFVDASRVQDPNHPLVNHKYELRVVVYRDGDSLCAFPSIAKIAREPVDCGGEQRRSLINNITASGDTSKVCGTDFMLPLCNQDSLQLLGLSEDDLLALSETCTGYVRHVVDQVEDRPEMFGLPQPQVKPRSAVALSAA